MLLYRLVKNLRAGKPLDIDVYDAAAWSVIVPLSEESVANRSRSPSMFRILPEASGSTARRLIRTRLSDLTRSKIFLRKLYHERQLQPERLSLRPAPRSGVGVADRGRGERTDRGPTVASRDGGRGRPRFLSFGRACSEWTTSRSRRCAISTRPICIAPSAGSKRPVSRRLGSTIAARRTSLRLCEREDIDLIAHGDSVGMARRGLRRGDEKRQALGYRGARRVDHGRLLGAGRELQRRAASTARCSSRLTTRATECRC